MNNVYETFLEIIKASLLGESFEPDHPVSKEEWSELFMLADIHNILPMFYESVYHIEDLSDSEDYQVMNAKNKVMGFVMQQIRRTTEFLALNRKLEDAGVANAVVKGIICRDLYPNPDYRLSGDEDILILPEHFEKCHEIMTSMGMVVLNKDEDIEKEYEVSYGKVGSPLHIEIHKSLFPPESDAYGDLNKFFENTMQQLVTISIQGETVHTLEYTDHLFFLICHAFKHFLHGGFGIRQICDIVMFANAYGERIDWDRINSACGETGLTQFVQAVFNIGRKYLIFDEDKACYPFVWRNNNVDEEALLIDCIEGGVYGASDMNRKHSSTITLKAVEADKGGKKSASGIVSAVFLPLSSMSGKYPYLKKHPYLLPAAWTQRVFRYLKEKKKISGESVSETLDMGKKRIELLKEYGITKK